MSFYNLSSNSAISRFCFDDKKVNIIFQLHEIHFDWNGMIKMLSYYELPNQYLGNLKSPVQNSTTLQ